VQKQISVRIERASWPLPPDPFSHFIPPGFIGLPPAISLDFRLALLHLGIMTIPIDAPEASLSAYWAHIRYLTAPEPSMQRLALSRSWCRIDPHQKTILSDDWGMGISTYWLQETLGLTDFCDGYYFMNRLRGRGVARYQSRRTRLGPSKSPDFVALDRQGRYHIIECKGTQSGARYLEGQIGDGFAQKRSLIFTSENLVAQRLVTGLHIGTYDGSEPSLLIIRDPPPRREQPRFIIETDDVRNIIDPIDRYRMARYLALIGGVDAATWTAYPDRRDKTRPRATRVAEYDSDLAVLLERGRFERKESVWIGRETTMPFVRPVSIDGHVYRAATLRYGMNENTLRTLKEMGLSDEPYRAPHRRPEQGLPEAVAGEVDEISGNLVSPSDTDFYAEMILE